MAEHKHSRRASIRRLVDSRQRPRAHGRSLAGTALTILLGLLLLTSGLGTWGKWTAQSQLTTAPITAGSVSLTGTLQVQLLSRQLVDKRTYASATACTATAPFVECRVVSATLAAERLIPGDTLRIVQTATSSGQGDNLKGKLVINAASVLDQSAGASAFAKSAAVSLAVTKPDATAATVNMLTSTILVGNGQPNPFGTYTAVVTIATPPTNGAARWNTALQGQTLNLGGLTADFTQTN